MVGRENEFLGPAAHLAPCPAPALAHQEAFFLLAMVRYHIFFLSLFSGFLRPWLQMCETVALGSVLLEDAAHLHVFSPGTLPPHLFLPGCHLILLLQHDSENNPHRCFRRSFKDAHPSLHPPLF